MAVWIAIGLVIVAMSVGTLIATSIWDRRAVESGLRSERRRGMLFRRAERNGRRFRQAHEAGARAAGGGRTT